VDETYGRVHGQWVYIYGAIDQAGQSVDADVSARRNATAADACVRRAMQATGVTPERVVTNKATCYPPALRACVPGVEHRRAT
jgi:transposase-like protein